LTGLSIVDLNAVGQDFILLFSWECVANWPRLLIMVDWGYLVSFSGDLALALK